MSFFGVLGKIAGGIVGAVGGLATGGPVGAVVGGLTGLGVGGSGGVKSSAALPGTISRGFVGQPMGLPTFTAATGLSLMGQPPGGGSPLLPHFACDRGQHHKKPHTKAERSAWFASKCVTNRHMNVTNPHALRRSIRRLHGFEKLARKVLRITSPRKPHVFGGPRRAKRRSR